MIAPSTTASSVSPRWTQRCRRCATNKKPWDEADLALRLHVCWLLSGGSAAPAASPVQLSGVAMHNPRGRSRAESAILARALASAAADRPGSRPADPRSGDPAWAGRDREWADRLLNLD